MRLQHELPQFIRESIADIGPEELRAIAKLVEALQNQYTRPRARALLLDAANQLKDHGNRGSVKGK